MFSTRGPGRAAPRGARFRPHPVGVYGLLAFVMLLTLLWEQNSVDHLLIRLERAKTERRDLESRVAALSVQVTDLSSMVQVEERAVRELGLRRPGLDEIVELEFPDAQTGEHFALGRMVSEAEARPRGSRRD